MRPQVLVVDDDEAVRIVVSELLSGERIDVHGARDGAEALEMLRLEEVPDLLLLDLAMPNVDGWKVLDALRADVRFDDLPIIVLTSFGSTEDLPHGVLALHKPIDGDLLLEQVHQQVDRPRGERGERARWGRRALERGRPA